MIRMVATDLDGTRCAATARCPTAAAALRSARRRPARRLRHRATTRWLDVLVEETGYVGVAVGANGAVLNDVTR